MLNEEVDMICNVNTFTLTFGWLAISILYYIFTYIHF